MKKSTKQILISLATVTALSLGAWATCENDVDMGEHKITNVADPVDAQDVATKAYVDAMIEKYTSTTFYRNDAKQVVIDREHSLMWQDNVEISSWLKKKYWLHSSIYEDCLEAIENGEDLEVCEDTSGDSATEYCEHLYHGGYSDWRLPSFTELMTISKKWYVFNYIAIDIHYWASGSNYNNKSKADAISFNLSNNNRFYSYDDPKSTENNVICVRDME